MKQQVSPVIIAVTIVFVLGIGALAYHFTSGGNSASDAAKNMAPPKEATTQLQQLPNLAPGRTAPSDNGAPTASR